MNPRRLSHREREDLRFFGKITASVTHELNNVFGIIGENSGLLSDRMMRVENNESIDREKIIKICETLQRHIERGQAVIKKLNTFAHSVDEPVGNFNLADAVQNTILLSSRFAYRKRVELNMAPVKGKVEINSCRFLVQQALFNGIMFMLNFSTSEDKMSLSLAKDRERATITINGADWPVEDVDEKTIQPLLDLMEYLGGECVDEPEDGRLKLIFPVEYNQAGE